MIVLAVDTASKSSSVAILDGQSLVAETTLVRSETHSRHLMDMIDGVMRLAAIRPAQMDFFSVTVGPGSFTGLRIGISAIKGLAVACAKPVVGISTLDALAEPFSNGNGIICPMLDARRGEVYFSRYRVQGGRLNKEIDEQALPPSAVLAGIHDPCLFIGDGAQAYRREIIAALGDRAAFGTSDQNTVRAAVVGLLAIRRFEQDSVSDPARLIPSYIRKSDAEKHSVRG